MIGKFEKKRKEQKKLLKELESIKSLLDDGELIDDDYSALAETAIKKSEETPPVVNEMPQPQAIPVVVDDIDDDFLIDDNSDIGLTIHNNENTEAPNIPILQEMVTDEPATANLAPGVLPGQQSLFEENAEKASKETVATETPTSPPKQTKEAAKKPEPAPKLKTTENPFLPKHIRERLNGTVDIPAYANPNEAIHSPFVSPQTFIPGAAQANSSTPVSPSSLNDVEQQEIIDALVNEFMPKIESKLRLRLAQMLAKSSTK